MRYKTWRTWTTLELRRLEEMRLAGLTAARIAAELGRTLASVKCRLGQEGIARPRLGAQRAMAALLGPHTIAGAAREMGIKRRSVITAKNRLRAAGFAVPPADRGE